MQRTKNLNLKNFKLKRRHNKTSLFIHFDSYETHALRSHKMKAYKFVLLTWILGNFGRSLKAFWMISATSSITLSSSLIIFCNSDWKFSFPVNIFIFLPLSLIWSAKTGISVPLYDQRCHGIQKSLLSIQISHRKECVKKSLLIHEFGF